MKNYKFLFALLTIIVCNVANAQTPANDPAWNLKSGTADATDDFNGTALDTAVKWWPRPYFWGDVNNGLEINKLANVTLNNPTGYLKIKADTTLTLDSSIVNGVKKRFYYQGGAIHAKTAYKYGYFEISAKYPTGAYSYWPAFWLMGQTCTSGTGWVTNYGEIDVCENGAPDSKESKTMGTNWHRQDSVGPTACKVQSFTDDGEQISNLDSLNHEHKYGILWEVDKMSWYFDDQLVRTVYDPVNTPNAAMAIILNFAVDPNYAPYNYNTWPAYFQVNYTKVWQLSTANCGTDETICTFTPGVQTIKKSIITNNTCTPTFNTSDNTTLRATDYILFDVGTTINDNGSGTFSAIVTPCPN